MDPDHPHSPPRKRSNNEPPPEPLAHQAPEGDSSDGEWYGAEESAVVPEPMTLIANTAMDDLDMWELSKQGVSLDEMRKHETTRGAVSISLSTVSISPPFLSKQAETDGQGPEAHSGDLFNIASATVSCFKDATADIARSCRNGSAMVTARAKAMAMARDSVDADARQYRSSLPSSHVAAKPMRRLNNRGAPVDLANVASLPISEARPAIMRILREVCTGVFLLIGETGSGKTTQLPKFGWQEGLQFVPVVCTQPRRVAATSVARRVAAEISAENPRFGTRLGVDSPVGYAIRFEDKRGPNTQISFVTDGILLREIAADPSLMRYKTVILDEVHERSLNTDVLLGLMKRVLSLRQDLTVILMSATMSLQRLKEFFNSPPDLTVPGRMFPVQTVYARSTPEDFVHTSIEKVKELHKIFIPDESQDSHGHILVFLPGREEIETAADKLNEWLEIQRRNKLVSVADSLVVLPLYSQLKPEAQQMVFEEFPNCRKVILSTNIAETSVTIPGVRWVIDCGLCRSKIYSGRANMDALMLVPISQQQADQRKGRAGRTEKGVCFRLYTAATYKKYMWQEAVPEIQRTHLGNAILQLRTMGIDLNDFPLLQRPAQATVNASAAQLWVLGALDDQGHLTNVGRMMARFPLEPSLSLLLVAGQQAGVLDQIASIVAMLSVPNPVVDAQVATIYNVALSDHLTLLNMFEQYILEEPCRRDEKCRSSGLNHRSLRHAKSIYQQLLQIAEKQLPPSVANPRWSLNDVSREVRKCLCAALYVQSAMHSSRNCYQCIFHNNLEAALSSKSAMFNNCRDYVVYSSLVTLRDQPTLVCVTSVEPQWLQEYCDKFSRAKETERMEALQAREAPVAVGKSRKAKRKKRLLL